MLAVLRFAIAQVVVGVRRSRRAGSLMGCLAAAAIAAPAPPAAAQQPPGGQLIPASATRDSLGVADLYRYVVAARETPLAAVRQAILDHPLVLLGDVHPAAEPKELVLQLLRDSAVADRLDAIAFEVPANAQRWIDAYLQSSPEDTMLLFRDPATLRSLWGGSDVWLALFHQLWELERTRSRPLHVIAMDLPGWPSDANSIRRAVSMFADRDSAMAAGLLQAVHSCGDACRARGGPRVLGFVGGYHVLRGLEADLSIGHNSSRIIWLATRLDRAGVRPFTILGDGLPFPTRIAGEETEGATRLFDVLARPGWPPAPYAIPTGPSTDVVKHAVREPDDPTDITFNLRPADYRLRGSVDLFIYWGQTTALGENAAPRSLGR